MIMKYKDLGKKLSKEEMKNLKGGGPGPGGSPCNVPADCGMNNCDNPMSGTNRHWDCRNHVCTFDTLCI